MRYEHTSLPGDPGPEPVEALIARLVDEAHTAIERHDPRRAVLVAEEALRLAKENAVVMPPEALLHLGYGLSDLYESDAALDCYRLVRDRFTVDGDVAGLAHVDMNVAIVYSQQERYEEAVELLEGAHEVFARLGIDEELDAARTNLVSALSGVGRHEAAIEVGRQAVESLRELDPGSSRLAAALCNTAHAEMSGGDDERARVAYIEALDLYRKLNLPTEEADCLDSLGVIALRDGLVDFAASMHEKAVEMYEGRDHDVDQALARYHLAIAELWRGNFGAALRATELATGVPGSLLDPAMVAAAALDGLGRRNEAATARAGFVERQTEEIVVKELAILPPIA